MGVMRIVLSIDVTRALFHLINAHHRIVKMILEIVSMESESILEKQTPNVALLNIYRGIIASNLFSDQSERILLLDVSGNLCPQEVKTHVINVENF